MKKSKYLATLATLATLALLLPASAGAVWGDERAPCSLLPAVHCYSVNYWRWSPDLGEASSFQAKIKTKRIKLPSSLWYEFVANSFWAIWTTPEGRITSWIEAGQIRTDAGRLEPMRAYWASYVGGQYVQHISEERAYPGKVDTFTLTNVGGYGQWCVKWYVPSPYEPRTERMIGCIYNPSGTPSAVESGAEIYTPLPPEVEGTVEVRNISPFALRPYLFGSFQANTAGGCGVDEIWRESFLGGVQCGFTEGTPETSGSKTVSGSSPA